MDTKLYKYVVANLLIIILFFVTMSLLQRLALFSTTPLLRYLIYIVITMAVSYAFIKLMNFVYRRRNMKAIVLYSGEKNMLFVSIIVSIAIFLAIIVILFILDALVFRSQYLSLISFINLKSLIYPFIITAVSVFFEDLVFWGGITHVFARRHRSHQGVFISGLLFGAAHMINLIGRDSFGWIQVLWLCNLFLAGILFAMLYIRFGLISPFIIHMLWNVLWGAHMTTVESSAAFTISYLIVIVCIIILQRHRNTKIMKSK